MKKKGFFFILRLGKMLCRDKTLQQTPLNRFTCVNSGTLKPNSTRNTATLVLYPWLTSLKMCVPVLVLQDVKAKYTVGRSDWQTEAQSPDIDNYSVFVS